MKGRKTLRLWGVLLCTLTLMVSAMHSHAKKDAVRSVKDLALGVALYDYFQQNDFAALTTIMLAEQQGSLTHQAAFADQIAAGIMLSYGLEEEAERRISNPYREAIASGGNRVVSTNENAARSHYYLAKLLYRKGQYDKAFEVLQKVDNNLSSNLKGEMAFLLDSSVLRVADQTQTNKKSHSKGVKRNSLWLRYSGYNKAVSTHQSISGLGDEKTASTQKKTNQRSISDLEKLAASLTATLNDANKNTSQQTLDELLSLRDRTLLTLAYVHLMQEQPRQALRFLQSYSSHGIDADDALLAYGWAYMQTGDLKNAYAAWSQLSENSRHSAAGYEANLGMSHLLELQGKPGAAIASYNKTIDTFSQDIDVLNSLLAEHNRNQLRETISNLQNSSISWLSDYHPKSTDWTGVDDKALIKRVSDLVSSNEFIWLLNQKRDTHWIANKNVEWSETLNAIENSLDNQRLRFIQVFDRDKVSAIEREYAELTDRVNHARSSFVAAVESNKNLMSDEQAHIASKMTALHQRRLSTLAELKSTQKKREGEPGTRANELGQLLDQQQRMMRLFEGQLDWQIAQQQAETRWEINKSLQGAEVELIQTARSIDAIKRLVPEQHSQQTAYDRLMALQKNNENLRKDAERLAQRIDSQLTTRVLETLRSQHSALTRYLGQAQLAKARLLDQEFSRTSVMPLNDDALERKPSSNPDQDSASNG